MAGAAGAQAGVGRRAGLCPGLGPGPEAAGCLGAAGPLCGHLDRPALIMSAQPDAGCRAAAIADLETVPESPLLQPGPAAKEGGWGGCGTGWGGQAWGTGPGLGGVGGAWKQVVQRVSSWPSPAHPPAPPQALLENRAVLGTLALLKRLRWGAESTAALTSWHLAYLVTWTTCLASHLLQAAFEHTAQLAQAQKASGLLSESPLPEPPAPETGPVLPEPGTPVE